jgi:DNA-binding NarL/FixJ family response regulator
MEPDLPLTSSPVQKGNMRGESVKLLLADDSEAICKAIRAFLSREPTVELLGEAHTLPQTVEMASMLQPDVVLLDLHMPAIQGFELSTVKGRLLTCTGRVIAMSFSNDDETRALAQEYGAATLLDKANLARELIPALLASVRAISTNRRAESSIGP